MSDLGRRLRQTLDEVAPPADLDRIVTHEPSLPFWRVGRALAYAAVLVAVVGVTGFLLTRVGSDDTAVDPSVTTVEGTVTTVGEEEASTSSTTTTMPNVPLVSPELWPHPALDPVLALPDCGPGDMMDFIYEEFPEFGGRDSEIVAAADIQDVMPLPRFGLDSVFTDDPTGWCFSSRRIDDLTAWKLQGPDPNQYVFAAARPRESNSVPDDVIDDYYHQSHIASGQGFNVSVRPEGRAVGVVDHDYFVMGGQLLQPRGDVHLWGEGVAMSLYKQPLEDDDPGGIGIGSLFDPTGLPGGFGPCTVRTLVWEQSGEGAEWFRTTYCDGVGREIEVLHGFGGDYPPPPGGESELWGRPPLSGATWVEEGRRNIVFDVDERRNLAVWVTGSEDGVTLEQLSAVTESLLLFRSELVAPRKGAANFADAIDPDAEVRSSIADAITQAPDGVTIRTNQWPDDGTGGSMLDQALALGANRIERLEAVDVVVLDNGDRVQAIFSCGGLWFNIQVGPDPVQQRPDLTWSQTDGRYEAIVAWLQVLEDSLGCTSEGSGPAPPSLLPFHLYVSNQSFEIDPVRIVVSLDGAVVVDDDFSVEGQHSWILHELEIAAGVHEIRVDAYGTGAYFEETFELTEESWAVLEFWTSEGQPPFLAWRGILDAPPAFL